MYNRLRLTILFSYGKPSSVSRAKTYPQKLTLRNSSMGEETLTCLLAESDSFFFFILSGMKRKAFNCQVKHA